MEEKIKASELRLGNYLTLSEKQRQELFHNQIAAISEYFKVCAIYSDGEIVLELDDENVDIEEKYVSPIPLTEQWLLDFNFKYHKTGEFWSKDGFKVWEFEGGFYHVNNETLTYFDNVHHLQNYYFFATYLNGTGKELTLKKEQ